MAVSMFSNPYNAQQEQMNALEKSSMGVAQLDGYGAITHAAGMAGGMLGQGLGNLAGGVSPEQKNEADIAAVKDIIGRYDIETAEGQASALAEIKNVSIEAWMEFSNQFKDLEVSGVKTSAAQQQKLDEMNATLDLWMDSLLILRLTYSIKL